MDLPNDDAATALVKAVLTALAIRFDDGVVKIDQAVFNAARIVKCYGTVAGKGDDIPDRPHRLSRIIDAPVHVEPVRRELLEEMVQRAKVEATAPQPLAAHENSDSRSRFDIDAFIAKHLSAREPVAHEGGRKWVLEECPFNPEHKAPDAAIFQRANDGPLAFKCFHNSCAGMTWKDVREKFEPRPNRQEKKQGAARSASPRLQPPKLLNYGELKGIETPMQRPLFDGYPLPARGRHSYSASRRREDHPCPSGGPGDRPWQAPCSITTHSAKRALAASWWSSRTTPTALPVLGTLSSAVAADRLTCRST